MEEYRANWQANMNRASPFAGRFAPRVLSHYRRFATISKVCNNSVHRILTGVKLASLIRRAHDRHLSVRKGSAVYLAGLKRI